MSVLVDGELVLTGFVGESFWEQGFTEKEILEALAEIGRNTDVNVRINSGGGYVSTGKAGFNALSTHKGKVTVYIEGMAASAASIIAMAGDEIIMRKGATMMIHDPMVFTSGNSAEHQKSIEYLEVEAVALAGIYSDVCGKSEDECRELMIAETWLSADQAVKEGFATKTDGKSAKAIAAFDYSIYQHAPKSAVAMAKKNSWNLQEAMKAAPSAVATSQQKDPPMADKTKADDNVDTAKIAEDAAKAATSRIGDILNCDEAKGRESLAKHFAFNSTMSVTDVKAALAAADKAETKTPAKNESEQSYRDRKSEAEDNLGGNQPPSNKVATAEKWKAAMASANAARGATHS